MTLEERMARLERLMWCLLGFEKLEGLSRFSDQLPEDIVKDLMAIKSELKCDGPSDDDINDVIASRAAVKKQESIGALDAVAADVQTISAEVNK